MQKPDPFLRGTGYCTLLNSLRCFKMSCKATGSKRWPIAAMAIPEMRKPVRGWTCEHRVGDLCTDWSSPLTTSKATHHSIPCAQRPVQLAAVPCQPSKEAWVVPVSAQLPHPPPGMPRGCHTSHQVLLNLLLPPQASQSCVETLAGYCCWALLLLLLRCPCHGMPGGCCTLLCRGIHLLDACWGCLGLIQGAC